MNAWTLRRTEAGIWPVLGETGGIRGQTVPQGRARPWAGCAGLPRPWCSLRNTPATRCPYVPGSSSSAPGPQPRNFRAPRSHQQPQRHRAPGDHGHGSSVCLHPGARQLATHDPQAVRPGSGAASRQQSPAAPPRAPAAARQPLRPAGEGLDVPEPSTPLLPTGHPRGLRGPGYSQRNMRAATAMAATAQTARTSRSRPGRPRRGQRGAQAVGQRPGGQQPQHRPDRGRELGQREQHPADAEHDQVEQVGGGQRGLGPQRPGQQQGQPAERRRPGQAAAATANTTPAAPACGRQPSAAPIGRR